MRGCKKVSDGTRARFTSRAGVCALAVVESIRHVKQSRRMRTNSATRDGVCALAVGGDGTTRKNTASSRDIMFIRLRAPSRGPGAGRRTGRPRGAPGSPPARPTPPAPSHCRRRRHLHRRIPRLGTRAWCAAGPPPLVAPAVDDLVTSVTSEIVTC
eukprot:9491037-Pyramimonas_sp.AAC.1